MRQKEDDPQLKGFVPATAYDLIFLWLMQDGKVYGYDLGVRFQEMTGGHIKVSHGTIYPLLRRMEKSGLIRSSRGKYSGRVYYELTPKGKVSVSKLTAEIEQSKKDFDEKLLGFISIYVKVFGREALKELLKRVQ